MGWASAGDIFDPVARALVELNAPEEMKRRVLGTLVKALQDGDWDTEGESLAEFRDDPVIVAIFKEHGVTLDCGADDGPGGRGKPCERKLGHQGDHVDEDDDSWWHKDGARP